jgi:3-phenylpropionate/cinnamic acid dioxygenase small subunit
MSNALHDDATLAQMALQYAIEQTLYAEAECLDERRFDDWLDHFTGDATYWMPIRSTRGLDDLDREFTKPGEGAHFDETRRMLEMRVYKLQTGVSWAEDPPSRTRHIVSNVRIKERHSETELTAGCNFIVYRARLDTEEDLWVGRRRDRLRNENGRWKIARREIYLDQTVLRSKNLSTFL